MSVQSHEMAPLRAMSAESWRFFLLWTCFWWGLVGVGGLLFFFGTISYTLSSKFGLYCVSIWLNAWLVIWWLGKRRRAPWPELYHDGLCAWLLSYGMTNLLWEVPWVLVSPFAFKNMNTVEDVVAHTDWMRSSIVNMYWWVLTAFSSVDLRTVNHSGTFLSLEVFCFTNVASTAYFFYLNAKRSDSRYLVPLAFCGQPIAATFIFTFSEVFDNFKNMPGGVADTLLALVWTQYQYFFFPMAQGALAAALLREDWRGKASRVD